MNTLSQNNIKGIVFDAYGTLFDVASIDACLVEVFGTEKAAEIATLWRSKQLQYTWLRSLMQKYVDFYALTEDALRFALSSLEVETEETVLRKVMSQYYHLSIYKDVKDTLDQLSDSYKLAILSNANPSLLEKAALFNEIDEQLDAVISADEVGCYKPDPRVYALAPKRLELPVYQILFVSSNTWDIAGATAYGLNTCWVNRKKGTMEVLGYQPQLSIKTLEQLLARPRTA